MLTQGIIDSTGWEVFAKEPKLAKLFWKLKSTLLRCHKNSTDFSRMSVTLNLLHFGALLREGQHVNGCFFRCGRSLLSVFHFGKKRHYLRVSSFFIVFFGPQLISQSSV